MSAPIRLPRPAAELASQAIGLLRHHVSRRPTDNPVRRFAERLAIDLPYIQQRGLTYFHSWAFATIRQVGSAFELAALHLQWLAVHGQPQPGLSESAADCLTIASQAKSLILKGARAAHSGKPLDASAMLDQMAQAWDRAMDRLQRL